MGIEWYKQYKLLETSPAILCTHTIILFPSSLRNILDSIEKPVFLEIASRSRACHKEQIAWEDYNFATVSNKAAADVVTSDNSVMPQKCGTNKQQFCVISDFLEENLILMKYRII